MGHLQMSFSFRVEPPNNSSIMCLVFVKVFAFCFEVPLWLSCSPMEAQPFGFASLQPLGVYPWQAYVSLDDGLWPIPGVH